MSAARYVDTLGERLIKQLTRHPSTDLRGALRKAIQDTAAELSLTPGPAAPSSTVAIVQETATTIDVLVLGDSSVIIAAGERIFTLRDTRLEKLGLPEHRAYRSRLASGAGYDLQHARILRALQQHQTRYRNRRHGFWIAEADPQAANHALYRRFNRGTVRWTALATDGATDTMAYLGLDDWAAIADMSDQQLEELLQQCHVWEAHIDPDGRLRPRAKRHDDKTLVVAKL